MISNEFFSLNKIERHEYTKAMREVHDERNLLRAYEYAQDLQGDLLDHVEDIHAVLVKDTLHGDLLGYRTEEVRINLEDTHEKLATIEVDDFAQRIEKIKSQKQKFIGLERLAFEHTEFLKAHPFVDGNGRLGRFILCKRLDDMGGRYFYRYLEKNTTDYAEAIYDFFYGRSDLKKFANFLKRITVF